MIRFTQQHSWLCPACQTSIRPEHEPLSPRPGVIYRCHVCRLELVLNEGAGKLDVAPLVDQEPPPEPAA
jgi:rubredoxin